MVRVRKSPNMMSTTGRRPVMAAPTASPVIPASEMGVSITRSVPNSSTRPDRTLNGVPASATSSPRINTRGSRRISSARSSRIASPKVISRPCASGVDILVHLVWFGVRGGKAELHRGLDLGLYRLVNLVDGRLIGDCLFAEPAGQALDGGALGHPLPLFFFR